MPTTDTLLVVPVRSGSRGIPGKAMRPLNGKAPVQYTLENALGLGDVVVVTDDPSVRAVAEQLSVRVVPAPKDLLALGLTWEPIVYHTVHEAERHRGSRYKWVAVLQCTSPFLRRATIQRCLAALEGNPVALTVADDRHARVGTPRMPRELMPPCWLVTGGCTAIQRDHLVGEAWPVESGLPVVVDGAEAVDLDTPEDWAIAEMYAGATEREQLLARVLSPSKRQGTAVILSAWDEQGEDRPRFRMAAEFPNAISLHGENTRDEAERAIRTRSGNDMTIVTSAYHTPRAFLTFVKVLHDEGLHRTVRLWLAPVESGWANLASEWRKITEYQAKGDVASIQLGLEYLTWRDSVQYAEPYACVA